MAHSIPAGMNSFIPAGMEWNEPFHSGRNEMFIPWTQIRNMLPPPHGMKWNGIRLLELSPSLLGGMVLSNPPIICGPLKTLGLRQPVVYQSLVRQ